MDCENEEDVAAPPEVPMAPHKGASWLPAPSPACWSDVTSIFCSAAKALALGELFHDRSFTLLEAMSAIEMMDPKMDAGMVCNKVSTYSLEEALSSGRLKVDSLSTSEQVEIIDGTVRCLVTWLEGHSLAQTCFTNLYLHNPSVITDKTIQSAAIINVKTICIILDMVYKVGAFEEEDFHTLHYNFYLGQGVEDMKACSNVKQSEEDALKRAKRIRQGDDEVVSTDSEKDYENLMALHSRLKFLRNIFQGLLMLHYKKVSGVEAAKSFLLAAKELLPSIRDSASAASNTGDYPTTPGFDATVNQRLLPSTFPRYTKIVGMRDACEYLTQMLQRIQDAMEVVHQNSYSSALFFFTEYSKQNPCVLSRSIAQMLYMPSPGLVFGVTQTAEILKDAVRSFCRPPILLAKSTISTREGSQHCRDNCEALLVHCVQPFFGLLLMSGHNRARQREKMARLMEDFALVQEAAERVDAITMAVQKEVEPNLPVFQWFTMWIMSQVLKVQIQYLLAGFELELYAVHEYVYVFWYLHEYLYRFLITSLTQADAYMLECDKRQRKQTKNRSKKAIKSYHQRELLVHQVLQNVCGGFYKTMVALRMDDKIQSPAAEFDQEKTRFEHRFAALAAISTPPVVSYAKYHEINDLSKYTKLTSSDVYSAASRCFLQAKVLYESISDLSAEHQSLLKITKNNLVVVNLLQSGHKKDAVVSFDHSQHMYFPLIKLC